MNHSTMHKLCLCSYNKYPEACKIYFSSLTRDMPLSLCIAQWLSEYENNFCAIRACGQIQQEVKRFDDKHISVEGWFSYERADSTDEIKLEN